MTPPPAQAAENATELTINLSADDQTLDSSTANSGGAFSYASPTITIHENADVIIIGSSTARQIVVDGDSHITLDNAEINLSGRSQYSAMTLRDATSVTLTLVGDNRLQSGSDRAGIGVFSGTSLHITAADDAQTLTAIGGSYSAGIGGSNRGSAYVDAGTIKISGGTVTANGGTYAAGIGGGYTVTDHGDGGTVEITSGVVSATGGSSGAGIGGGFSGDGGTVSIHAGTVDATGTSGGAGIGGGAGSTLITDGNGGETAISGGMITASAGSGNGSAIGTGYSNVLSGTKVTITGGSVNAASINPSPTDGTNIVYANTLTVGDPAIGKDKEITEIEIDGMSSNYGLKDVVTAADSLLYFWLPENATGDASVSVIAEGVKYSRSFQRGQTSVSAVLLAVTELGLSTGELDFGSVELGYSTPPAAQTVTVANLGSQTAHGLGVSTSNAFDIVGAETTLASGGSFDLSIRPKPGLAGGVYQETIDITGENFAALSFSVFFEVKLPQEATPDIAIDYRAELLTGFLTNGTYSINGDSYNATAGSVSILENWFGTTVSIIRQGDGTATADSNPFRLAIPARPNAPDGVGVAATAPGAQDGKITGVTTAMEYQAAGDSSWIPCPDGEITDLAPGDYLVRIAATDKSFKSQATSVTVPKGLLQEPTPEAKIDFIAETLTGLSPNEAYTINGVAYTADAVGTVSIGSAWLGTRVTIVKTCDEITTRDSEPQNLNIPARPAAPDVTGVAETALGKDDGKITGVTTAMEYRASWNRTWTVCASSAITGLIPGNYQVQYAATETAFYVRTATVTVPNGLMQEPVPAAVIDYFEKTLTELSKNDRYTINGTAYIVDGDGTIPILEEWMGTTVRIVKTGGSETEASDPQLLDIPARDEGPIVIPSSTDRKILYTTEAMEYKLQSNSVWTRCMEDETTVPNAGIYQVRYAATESAFSSQITYVLLVEGIIIPTPPVTVYSIDYLAETITGMTANERYTINDVEYTTDENGTIPIDEDWFGTSIAIVEPESSTIHLMEIPDRPEAPEVTGIDETASSANDGRITGVTTAMEYRAAANDEWISCTGDEITDLAPGEYLVRIAATETSFAGITSTVVIQAATEQRLPPHVIIDYIDEAFEELEPGRTYTVDGESFIADDNGTIPIDEDWMGTTVEFVLLGDGADVPDSTVLSLDIPARPEAPAVTAVNETGADKNDGKITGTSEAMEYRAHEETEWTRCTGDEITGLAPGCYLVRHAATETSFAGKAAAVNVPQGGKLLSPYVSGYPDGSFQPNRAMERGEAVQMLYNLINVDAAAASSISFTDVAPGAWYYDAVTYLTGNNVISGYPDGSFQPYRVVTRAEFTAMIVGFMGLEPEGTPSFADVGSNHWAADFIATAEEAGLISGYPNGNFGPNDVLTRAQAVSILNSMMERSTDEALFDGIKMPFTDVTTDHWAYYQIMAAGVEHNE